LDVDLLLNRPACVDGRRGQWHSRTTLTLRDVAARYVHLPYPVEHLRGVVVVGRGLIEVQDIHGESGSARITVDGEVLAKQDTPAKPDLTVTAQNVAFDDVLLSALPEDLRESLRAFNATGHFDVASQVSVDPAAEKTTFVANIALHDAAIVHRAFPVRIEGVSGRLRMTPNRVVVEKATGRYREGTVSATGTIDRTEGEARVDLTMRCRDLEIDEAFCSAAPKGLGEVLSEWRVEGPVSSDTRLRLDPTAAEGGVLHSTVARLDGVPVRHSMFPVPFEQVRGLITFDQAGSRGTGIEARYGDADLTIDFEVGRATAGREGTIKLTAMGAALDERVRDILPKRLRRAWDRRSPHGKVNLHLAPLRFSRPDPEGPLVWHVDGRVELIDVGVGEAGKIDTMTGTLTVSGPVRDRLGGMALGGQLDVSRGRLLGRDVAELKTPWSLVQAADHQGRLAFDSIQAGVADGTVTARFQLDYDRQASRYDLSANAHDLEIALLRGPDQPSRARGEGKRDVRGRADAHLYLSGEVDDPLSKRGGGRVEIRNGYLYRLPIMLAILNVINLSVPQEPALQDAEADFYIVGERMALEGIVLKSDVLALVGSGSMSLPDQGLDLSLVYASPQHWTRVPLLTDFVEWASRPLTELHITGPLFQPTVRASPFRGVNEEIKGLFQKKKPRKIQPQQP
jgi:hypothetical protein